MLETDWTMSAVGSWPTGDDDDGTIEVEIVVAGGKFGHLLC